MTTAPALERFIAHAQARTGERAAPADCVLSLAPLMLELVEQAGEFLQPQHYRSDYVRLSPERGADEGIELARGGVILLGRGAVLAHNES